MFHDLLEFNEEVLDAINDKNPIVALESTIISHGMPYPDNLTTAIEVENIIRRQGAIPATIAMHQGKIRVGLTQEVMEHLALQKEVIKASRRDISLYYLVK